MIRDEMTAAEVSAVLEAIGMRVRSASCSGALWRCELEGVGEPCGALGDTLEEAVADAIAECLAGRYLASLAEAT